MLPYPPFRTASPPLLRWFLPVFAILLACLVLSATPWGLGVTPDSLHYIEAATSFYEGRGFADFSSHWAPLYPIAIAGTAWLQGDVLAAARWLNAGLAGVNLILLALVVGRFDWRNDVATVFLLLLGLQAGFLHVHYLLWTEALFLTFALANLLFLQRATRGPASRWIWAGLIAAAAAAIMVRYAGLFLLLLNASVLLLFLQRRSVHQRIVAAVAVSAGCLLPFVAWTLFNRWRGLSAVNRSFVWHPPTAEHVDMLGSTIATWFGVTPRVGLVLSALILLLLVHQVLLARIRQDNATSMPAAIALFALAYATFLFFSISFADHYSPLDERMLFPLFPMTWILLAHFALSQQGKFAKAALMVLFSIFLLRGTWHGWEDWRATRENGLGLTSRHIQAMPILAWMRTLPPTLPIVSNGPDICTIHLQRSSTMLPVNYNPTSLIENADARTQLEAMTQGPTLVVHFEAMAYRKYLSGPQQLEKLPNMRLVYRGDDAVAWIRNADQPLP